MALADALTKSDNAELTVDQVALAADLGIDTVRYYQRLGLIPAPVRKGRRAAYCEEHVTRLAEIRRLADDGFTLAQIAALGDEGHRLRAEESLKRLDDSPETAGTRRKVGGLPSSLSIFELGFAGKGRIYYAKGRQRAFRILAVGGKASQKQDLDYLSRLSL